MGFQIITVVIILSIFGLFAFGAYRAEKAVSAKIQENREAHAKLVKTAKKKL